MVRRLLLALSVALAVVTSYAMGQTHPKPPAGSPGFSGGDFRFQAKDPKPLPGGPVFSGADFGFQADEPMDDVTKSGRRFVTGKFVVNVNGRWVEARTGFAAVPAR